jgi:di/tricarboxylate transporter
MPGPTRSYSGLFLITTTIGELISNTAALIVIPIAISAATDMGVSTRPVLMSIAKQP